MSYSWESFRRTSVFEMKKKKIKERKVKKNHLPMDTQKKKIKDLI